MELNDITEAVIGAAIHVHRELGPGLLEKAYQTCLAHEMKVRGLHFLEEEKVPLLYGTVFLPCVYRCDFLVEDRLIVELKAVDSIAEIHRIQVTTYLRLLGLQLGLLLNFNTIRLADGGIQRVPNNYKGPKPSETQRVTSLPGSG